MAILSSTTSFIVSFLFFFFTSSSSSCSFSSSCKTMDFTQRKLTKAEWESIEVPIVSHERRICELIQKGFHNVLICQNTTVTIIHHCKVTKSPEMDKYIYSQYLYPPLQALAAKYKFAVADLVSDSRHTIKKADIIRFVYTEKQILLHKSDIFEFVVLDMLAALYKSKAKQSKEWLQHYYTVHTVMNYQIDLTFRQAVVALLTDLTKIVDVIQLLSMGQTLIEKNDALLVYADEKLYEHQKRLFTLCKKNHPKLILYNAPTGTGKTMSPIGLSERYKIIFVCAARHVGLALAKAAISCQKKVAFAFGCHDASDIRLHYYAAKEYTKNKKSGGIGKVDNSKGEKVELIISDIQSFVPAMLYMLAFNSKDDIILYWDEPTIAMDYTEHEFHAIIQRNWQENLIPNVVLSSATLPHLDELTATTADFKTKFADAEVYELVSYDCVKTIPIVNREGFVEMPHSLFADSLRTKAVVAHCQRYQTLLRYIDLGEAIRFIQAVHTHVPMDSRYALERHFSAIHEIAMAPIKLYYLELLGAIPADAWPKLYAELQRTRSKKYESTINAVTKDAHTLTDGPTIFLADDVDKMAIFYIQSANIPPAVISNLLQTIQYNAAISDRIGVMQKNLEDGTQKDDAKEKKSKNDARLDPEMKRLMQSIEEARYQLRQVILDPIYVPNTADHLHKNAPSSHILNKHSLPFSCDIGEHIVTEIMLVDNVEASWKLLLLIGIGIFSAHKSDRYTEIMKKLALEQKLFMIIASSDYIYGTNYQFCHGYIGKDLHEMSQEKCIQAMGRVGRNKLQQDYSVRFRENDLIVKLFTRDDNKPEVKNMNLLFCASANANANASANASASASV